MGEAKRAQRSVISYGPAVDDDCESGQGPRRSTLEASAKGGFGHPKEEDGEGVCFLWRSLLREARCCHGRVKARECARANVNAGIARDKVHDN